MGEMAQGQSKVEMEEKTYQNYIIINIGVQFFESIFYLKISINIFYLLIQFYSIAVDRDGALLDH